MANQKRKAIQLCCIFILILFGCNKQSLAEKEVLPEYADEKSYDEYEFTHPDNFAVFDGSYETLSQAVGREEVEQIYYGEGLGFSDSPYDNDTLIPDTFICYPYYKGDREQFTKDYLQNHGFHREEPDGINEQGRKKFSEFYIDEEAQRFCFIFYSGWDNSSLDEDGYPYQDCIYYVTVDKEQLESKGYLAKGYGECGELIYQRSYDMDGMLEGYLSYEYDSNIPFPVITERKNYVDYPLAGINYAFYHEFYKEDMIFDESGRWTGYRSCFLGEDTKHDNICVYNSQGKLESVREVLLDEDREQEYDKEYSAELYIKYNEAGNPISSEYWGSNNTHRIGSGIAGEFEYDGKGRIVSWSFINGQVFFVYDGDNTTPWARIAISGMPNSSYGYEEGIAYGNSTDVYLFLGDE